MTDQEQQPNRSQAPKTPGNQGAKMPGGTLDLSEGEIGGTAAGPSRSTLGNPDPESIIANTNPSEVGGVPGTAGGSAGGAKKTGVSRRK